ncbi:hypothetical protein GCM10023147_24760 [Tsukamurella soli]|uniref:Uncharacterized protein n=1 Tax=Tsukamurella soli TaxID=644556 RepID=A0ABP8JNX3_9ACTN
MPQGACLVDPAGSPGCDQRCVLPRGDVRRREDGTVGTQRECRAHSDIVAREKRDAVRPVREQAHRRIPEDARRVLESDHAVGGGQLGDGVESEDAACASRDVVDDDGQWARGRHGPEVRDDAGGGGTRVVRHDHEYRAGAPVHLSDSGDGGGRRVAAGADGQHRTVIRARLRAHVEHGALLRRGERGRLARRAEGYEADGACREDVVGQPLEAGGVEAVVGRERGDQGNVQSGEIHTQSLVAIQHQIQVEYPTHPLS